jgi:hypothetical protein
MRPEQLPDEYLSAIHAGAEPIPRPDRRAYYNLVSAWLDHCPLLTKAALMEAIRAAQRWAIFRLRLKKISPANRSPRLCTAPFAGHPFGFCRPHRYRSSAYKIVVSREGPYLGSSAGRALKNHDKSASDAGGANHRYWDSWPR